MVTFTDHQYNWWGTQPCRRCNPLHLPSRQVSNYFLTACPDCDGTGWTEWAALATEPWSEIIPNLWMGGHDWNSGDNRRGEVLSIEPDNSFDVVVSLYARAGHGPPAGTEHIYCPFEDHELDAFTGHLAIRLAKIVADRLTAGKVVLTRCQAGLNRSGVIAGLAMVQLGYTGDDAVQIIRAKRSPWALCNESYARFIRSHGELGVQA